MANHNQVAHAWANKTGKHRTGHHIYYSHDTIYSYGTHFPIARHITLPDNTPAVLFTTKSYSQSTGQHKSIVRSACSHIRTIMVKDPSALPSQSDVTALLVEAEQLVQRAGRARTNGPFLIEQAALTIEAANTIIDAFSLPIARLSLDSLGPDLAAIRETARLAQAQREAKRVAEQAQARADWQQGLPNARFYGTDEFGNAYLRVSADLNRLETSQGASVPLEHAKRVFQRVAQCRAQSVTWHRNGSTIRVGDFQVDTIQPDGSFKAGCHTFAWPEIARVAASIGLTV